jgi:iron complex outermembrane recepter protein
MRVIRCVHSSARNQDGPTDLLPASTPTPANPMNPSRTPLVRIALAHLLVAAIGSTLAFSQTVSPPAPTSTPTPEKGKTPIAASSATETGEVVELSPFVVRAEEGWNATQTLSGTRLRTDLRDVPNQVETFTKDFMNDLALNNIEEALIYSANSENNSEYLSSNAETSSFYLNNSNRVRGLTSGTNSTSLFRSSIASDNYNLDSTAVSSGPNSTLFGMGTGAGTFDNSPAWAIMRNRVGTRLQYSSENSKRATLDLNRVLIPNVLSVRLMGLWENEETHTKPNHDKDKRLTGAITFQPFKNTTIRARFEHVERDANRAPRTLPYDYISLWLYANQVPGSPYTAGMPGYDNRTAIPANVATTSKIFAVNNNSAVFITNSPSSPVMGWGQSVQVRNPSDAYGVPDASFDSGRTVTFMNGSIIPTDVNPFGDLKDTKLGGNIRSVFLEQKLAKDLYLELAYNQENSYQNTLGGRGQGISRIYADANLYLPALLPGQTTYQPNPNYGKYYIDYLPNANPQEFYYQDFRATLSYELDLQRKSKGWMHWLGRHRFALVASRNDDRTRQQLNFEPRIFDDPVLPGRTLTAKTASNWAVNATRNLRLRSYLDESFRPVAPLNGLDGSYEFVDGNGQPFRAIGSFDSGLVDANGKRLSNARTGVSAAWNRTDTGLLAYQGRFLPDREGNSRLILIYGYRRDKAKSAIADLASRTGDTGAGRTGLFPLYSDATWADFGATETGLTRNTGVILRPVQWLSLHYSKSATFDVSSTSFGPFGDRYPGSAGDGKEYGFSVDLWQDKLSLRVTRYENAVGPTLTANQIDNFRTIFTDVESRVRQLDPALSAPDNWFSATTNLGFNLYHIYSDRTSEGYELSLNFRPVPNWNIRINGAKSSAKEDKIGLDWIEWVNVRRPVWESVVAKNGEVDSAGQPLTWLTADVNPTSDSENRTLKQFYDEQLAGTALAFMQASNGKVSDGARGKRANLVTNYRFTEGKLKGVTIGGALRWRPAPVTGYPIKVNELGVKLLDVEHAYYGKQEFPVDLTIGYRGRMRYLGGIGYNVQLNVRNLMDRSDPIPVTSFSNGAVARLATVEPRLIICTVGFDF